jgi:hypothetical protein
MRKSPYFFATLAMILGLGAVACSASPTGEDTGTTDDESELRTQICGGVAGLQCPTGYACEITASHPDAAGKCKKVKKCGGIAGLQCPSGYDCDIEDTFPDAMGTCSKHHSAPLPHLEDFQDCTQDSDCKRVHEEKCCPDGSYAAIAKSQESAYQEADWCPSRPAACPLAMRLDQRVAQCNVGKGKCEMIAIDQIACGGFTQHPHHCPSGYDCVMARRIADAPGRCAPSDP